MLAFCYQFSKPVSTVKCYVCVSFPCELSWHTITKCKKLVVTSVVARRSFKFLSIASTDVKLDVLWQKCDWNGKMILYAMLSIPII